MNELNQWSELLRKAGEIIGDVKPISETGDRNGLSVQLRLEDFQALFKGQRAAKSGKHWALTLQGITFTAVERSNPLESMVEVTV